jgi:hypothetical protein
MDDGLVNVALVDNGLVNVVLMHNVLVHMMLVDNRLLNVLLVHNGQSHCLRIALWSSIVVGLCLHVLPVLRRRVGGRGHCSISLWVVPSRHSAVASRVVGLSVVMAVAVHEFVQTITERHFAVC